MTYSPFERPGPLAGRGRESARLDRLLADARAGQSAVLVLRGEPGVGKTALLGYAAERAAGFQVVRAAGAESEMELPFASLHQLCGPMLGGLERLPPPQRDALGTAFGLSSGAQPDRFLIGLAILSLLSDTAEERPLLCLVDDAQWLDRSSAQVLAFVARRLQAESVVLLFAERKPGELDEIAGLPDLPLRGLSPGSARELLASAISGPLDARVQNRILAEARGNPLALLELPNELSPAELAGGFGLPGGLPLPGRIEESFLRRAQQLPAATQRLLLVAAAEPTGEPLGSAAGKRPGPWVSRPRQPARAGRWPARSRRASHLPPLAAAVGDLPRRGGGRTSERASGAVRGHRCRDRSRPPGLAPRPRDARA